MASCPVFWHKFEPNRNMEANWILSLNTWILPPNLLSTELKPLPEDFQTVGNHIYGKMTPLELNYQQYFGSILKSFLINNYLYSPSWFWLDTKFSLLNCELNSQCFRVFQLWNHLKDLQKRLCISVDQFGGGFAQ